MFSNEHQSELTPPNDAWREHRIGKGGFANVYRAVWRGRVGDINTSQLARPLAIDS
jgi:hypothetical protein|eukprot:SAG25_NODE_17_length_24192_cov_70.399452_21_plen_56_part_00